MDDDKRFGEFWKLCYGSQDLYFSITPRILIESCFLLLLFYPSGGWGSRFARCFQWLNSNVRTAFRIGKTTEFRKSKITSKTQFINQETVSLPQVITTIYFHAVKKCFNWPGCDILIVEVKWFLNIPVGRWLTGVACTVLHTTEDELCLCFQVIGLWSCQMVFGEWIPCRGLGITPCQLRNALGTFVGSTGLPAY